MIVNCLLEEKEKRKDEFEKEVQKIIKAEEQTAEEMARRAKMKVTRQGIVDNDGVFPAFKPVRERDTTLDQKTRVSLISSFEEGRKRVQTSVESEENRESECC